MTELEGQPGPAGEAKPPGRKRRSLKPRLPRLRKTSAPGSVPGIELEQLSRMPSGAVPAMVRCIDYGPGQVRSQEVRDLDAFIAGHRPEWATVRWINVDGLTDMRVVRAFAEKY